MAISYAFSFLPSDTVINDLYQLCDEFSNESLKNPFYSVVAPRIIFATQTVIASVASSASYGIQGVLLGGVKLLNFEIKEAIDEVCKGSKNAVVMLAFAVINVAYASLGIIFGSVFFSSIERIRKDESNSRKITDPNLVIHDLKHTLNLQNEHIKSILEASRVSTNELQIKLDAANHELETKEKSEKDLKAEVEALKESIVQKDSEKQLCEKAFEESKVRHESELKEVIKMSVESLEKLDQETKAKKTLEAQLVEADQNIQRRENEREEMLKSLEVFKSQLELAETEIEKFKNALEKIEENQKSYDQLNEELKATQDALKKKESELEEFLKEKVDIPNYIA